MLFSRTFELIDYRFQGSLDADGTVPYAIDGDLSDLQWPGRILQSQGQMQKVQRQQDRGGEENAGDLHSPGSKVSCKSSRG